MNSDYPRRYILKSNASGNAFFLILLGVALFAALGVAVTQSMRGGSSGAEKERGELQVSEVLQFTTALKSGIARMILNGTPVTSLCFDDPNFLRMDPAWGGTRYNAASCATPRNRVFGPEGGNVVWQELPKPIQTSFDNSWWVTGNGAIQDVGTTAADLLFVIIMDRTDKNAIGFCDAVNKKHGLPLGTDTVNPNDWRAGFRGTFNTSLVSGNIAGDDFTPLAGQRTGCFIDGHSGGALIFYSVLYDR